MSTHEARLAEDQELADLELLESLAGDFYQAAGCAWDDPEKLSLEDDDWDDD